MTLSESTPAPPGCRVLRLSGNSPCDALRAGDLLTVQLGREPRHDNLVAVREGDGLVLRRCRYSLARFGVLLLGRMDDRDWRPVAECDVVGVVAKVERSVA